MAEVTQARAATARNMARKFGVRDSEVDDAAQEGLIRVMRLPDDAGEGLVVRAIQFGIRDWQRGYSTGAGGSRFGNRKGAMVQYPTDPADMPDSAEAGPDIDTILSVRQAVASLPDMHRRYVEAKFYHDLTEKGIHDELGMHPSGLRRHWRENIRPTLHERLQGM